MCTTSSREMNNHNQMQVAGLKNKVKRHNLCFIRMTPSVSGMVSAYKTRALYKYNNCITFKFSLVEAPRPSPYIYGTQKLGTKEGSEMTQWVQWEVSHHWLALTSIESFRPACWGLVVGHSVHRRKLVALLFRLMARAATRMTESLNPSNWTPELV